MRAIWRGRERDKRRDAFWILPPFFFFKETEQVSASNVLTVETLGTLQRPSTRCKLQCVILSVRLDNQSFRFLNKNRSKVSRRVFLKFKPFKILLDNEMQHYKVQCF